IGAFKTFLELKNNIPQKILERSFKTNEDYSELYDKLMNNSEKLEKEFNNLPLNKILVNNTTDDNKNSIIYVLSHIERATYETEFTLSVPFIPTTKKIDVYL
ncbi:MAG: hypothetical protein LBM93_08045, partial [Oscillospiraceae bacterium]|nr:hypothetical protein [Oscillospiraceae bacterium]